MNHAARLDALIAGLGRPLLVTNLVNIRYLSGFGGSSAALLVHPDRGSLFMTDGRYGELAADLVGELNNCRLGVSTSGMMDQLVEVLNGIGEYSVESNDVSWHLVRTLGDQADGTAIPTEGIVEELRRTKDDDEVAALAAAGAAGDAAFSALGSLIATAGSEADLGWALLSEMRRRGGDPASWEPIVAAGPGASIPHYRSGREPVGSGLLLLDYGCTVEGYHSDMSRTVWLDGEPDDRMAEVYDAVLVSQQAGIDAIAPGVRCGDVDEACRKVLRERGMEEHFLHSTGHGVGLEIHEAPWLRKGNDGALAVGDVVTVEPGVYLRGVGGVRIEDMVLVSADGPVVLTKSSREFRLT